MISRAKFTTLFLGANLLIPPLIAQNNSALKFEKKIGVGWQQDLWQQSKYGWMSFVSFNLDGTMVASDGATAPDDVSGNLTLWSFPEGQLIRQVPEQPTALSSDWKYYATFHGVSNLETGESVISLGDDVYAVYAFSPDNRYVAELPIRGARNPKLRVVELASGKQVSSFVKHTAFSVAISPDGVTLASGHWDIVSLWNMFTGKRLAVLRGFGRYVKGIAFSRDGKLLAAGTDAGGVQVWNVQTQTRVASIQVEGGEVSIPQFSPDGRRVAVGIYGTGTAWLIDVSSGKIIDHQQVSDLGCGSVAFSPDGHFLVTPSTGGLIRWPYDQGGTIRVFKISTN